MTRNPQEGETRRNLEIYLSTTANRQTPQTPPILEVGNADSKLAGASRPMLSMMPTDGGRKEDGELKEMNPEGIEEGECEGLEAERVDENMDKIMNLRDPSDARGSFDLNHTIHSRPGGKKSFQITLILAKGCKKVTVEQLVSWKE